MPEKLKKVIGTILLIVSVSGVSCGSVFNAIIVNNADSGSVERIK